MKEVIAVTRPEKWQPTLAAAAALGLTEYSQMRVMGRGRQRGLRYMRPVNGSDDGVMQFLPKRMLTWLVPDELVAGLVRGLISVNKTDNYGDGKVFVCPVAEVIAGSETEEPESAASVGAEFVETEV